MSKLDDQPRKEQVAFGRVLYDAALLADLAEVFDYFEKPYKWQVEYDAWVDMDKPTHDSDPSQWSDFIDVIDEIA